MKTNSIKFFQIGILVGSLTISAIFVSCGQENKNSRSSHYEYGQESSRFYDYPSWSN